jgi:hypothetical protein
MTHHASAPVRAALAGLLSVLSLSCGSSGSNSNPITPTPTPAPTPAPEATPAATSYGCPLPRLPDQGITCPKLQPKLLDHLNIALDKTIREHPEYFDLNDSPGAGAFKVLDRDRYIKSVVDNIRAQGVCAIEEKEEVALKTTNDFNEQYNIWSSSGYIRRAYITTCFPAQF